MVYYRITGNANVIIYVNVVGRESHWNEVIDALTQKMKQGAGSVHPSWSPRTGQTTSKAMTLEHVLVEVQSQPPYTASFTSHS